MKLFHKWISLCPLQVFLCNGSLARYVKLRLSNAPEMPGAFSPPPRVSDPDIHHGTCVTHVPWCMLVSLTSGFRWSRWRERRSRHSRRMRTRNFTYLVRGPCRNQSHPAMPSVPLNIRSRLKYNPRPSTRGSHCRIIGDIYDILVNVLSKQGLSWLWRQDTFFLFYVFSRLFLAQNIGSKYRWEYSFKPC